MAAKLRIEYIVEPDAAALARRTAQHFVEVAEHAVAKRGVVRIAISGGSVELLGSDVTACSRGSSACRGKSWSFTGWMSGLCRRITRRATTA